MAVKKIRRTAPITPIAFTRSTKEFRGVTIMSDAEDNVTITAHWLIPQKDGTIDRSTASVEAGPIQAMSGFGAIITAIVAASKNGGL